MENPKLLRMQYPYDVDNPIYDGTEHDVVPTGFVSVEINGRPCLIMLYYDALVGKELVTVLTEIDGRYYKVPLSDDDYTRLPGFIGLDNPRLSPEEVAIEGPIGLAMSMKLPPEPSKDSKFPEDVMHLDYYVPLNPTENTSAMNATYRFSSIKEVDSEQSNYSFSKTPMCELIAGGIHEGTRKYYYSVPGTDYLNSESVKRYDFEVTIPPGTKARKKYIDGEGNQRELEYAMIPGKYSVTVYYGNFTWDDYEMAEKSDKIEIKAPTSEYRDLHDVPVVFRDGGAKLLDMSFKSMAPTKQIN